MSVIVPVCFTPIDENELSEGQPVTEETMRKLVQNINLLGKLAVVGSIRAIAVQTPGVPVPNPDQFQHCDGSPITNDFSPLRSTDGHERKTPKLNDKYIRGAQTTTENHDTGDLEPGKSATRDLSHTHNTGFVCQGTQGEEGDERHGYDNRCHNHGITTDLSEEDPIELAHVQTAFYLKIN